MNDIAPDFPADTTEGTINFHDWVGDGDVVMFSHPKDFIPVCATVLGTMAGMKECAGAHAGYLVIRALRSFLGAREER